MLEKYCTIKYRYVNKTIYIYQMNRSFLLLKNFRKIKKDIDRGDAF